LKTPRARGAPGGSGGAGRLSSGPYGNLVAMQEITLTPVGNDDEAVLFALFSEVRAEELAMAGWDAALRDLVLRQQFAAQRRGHRAQYPAASELLILLDGRPAGWTVLDRSGPMWHCVDIAIGREFRRRKIATHVIRAWQDEAAAAGCGIVLSVLRTNHAARALYDGLGFRPAGQTETHWEMEWRR
jgi:ribosomal protein S18 acetylase RimI-like enzyme